MFGTTTRLLGQFKEQQMKDLRRIIDLENRLGSLADRLYRYEHYGNQVKVKVIDEDGNPITTQLDIQTLGEQRHPHGQKLQKYTELSVTDVIKAITQHLGMDLSVIQRDPEVLRIEDEAVEFVVDVYDAKAD